MFTKSIPHALLIAARGAAMAFFGFIVLMQASPRAGNGEAFESGLHVLYILGIWPWVFFVSVGSIMALRGLVEAWRHASSRPRL